jgi:hypothetical protein
MTAADYLSESVQKSMLRRNVCSACDMGDKAVATLRFLYEQRDTNGRKVYDFNDGNPLEYLCSRTQNLAALYYFLSLPDVDVTSRENDAFLRVANLSFIKERTIFCWKASLAFLEDGRVLDNALGMIRAFSCLQPTLLPIVASCLSQKQCKNICMAINENQWLLEECLAIASSICCVLYPKSVIAKSISVAVQECCVSTTTVFDHCCRNLPPHLEFLQPTLALVRRKHFNGIACNTLIDVCLALFPLRLPSYVLLWIIEWLPEMRDNDGKPCLKEVDALKRIIRINQDWFKKKQETIDTKRIKRV